MVYYGDFYPLTPYTQDNRQWIAWQFNVPERGEAAIQAFRRAESTGEESRLKLYDLQPDAQYTVTTFDTAESSEATGQELMTAGLPVVLRDEPSATVILIRRTHRRHSAPRLSP